MTALKHSTRFLPAIASEVMDGLARQPRRLPSKLFYDARGSELFEEITQLPEYYLTRTEQEILQHYAGEIAEAAGSNLTLVELGAGSAVKTSVLIEALFRRQLRVTYIPIDVSRSALQSAAKRLLSHFPNLKVRLQVADFTNGFTGLDATPGRRLAMFIGSSIGNFEREEAVAVLTRLRRALRPGDALLLGTDLVKSPALLVAAYDDSRGVTAMFNKNLLLRLNRELRANFNLDAFRHVALWNSDEARMEMHLESLREQRVAIAGLGVEVRFAAGERIHTENSYKYTVSGVYAMLLEAGWQPERTWTDHRRWFGVHLARAV